MKKLQAGLAVALAAGTMLGADAVHAASGAVIEELVVTARKREESVQDVPVSIQAFDSQAIERYNATNLVEIADLANQVEVRPGSSGNGGSVSIRGVGAPTLDPGIEGSVTVNVDGIQVDRGHIVRQGFFDLQSVQVLKGPQALFFGKNSPAGVIAVEGARPSFQEYEAKVQVGYEFEADEIFGEMVLSGPLTENLAGRLAYRGSAMDGWIDNNAQPIAFPAELAIPGLGVLEPFDFPGAAHSKLGGDESHALRLTLDWQPTDNFEAVLRVLGSTYETDNFATLEIISCSGDQPITSNILTGAQLVDPFGDCSLNGNTSHGSNPPEVAANWPGAGNGEPDGSIDQVLASLNMEWVGDNYTFTSVTGFYDYDYFRFDNFDQTVFWQLGGMQLEDHQSLSQEFRVHSNFAGPVNFMGGVYLETFERDSDNRGKIAPVGADPVTGFTNNWEGLSTVESDSWSAFTQVTWDITDQVELAGGVRYSEEDREAVQGNSYAHAFLDGIVLRSASLPPLESEFKDENWSPEVTLSWRPQDNLTLFAAYRTGYKAGGFSTNTVLTPIATEDNVVFDAEEAEGFEVGIKSRLLEGRMLFNATAYSYEFDNLQVSAFDPATTSFRIENAASSTTEGVEIDTEFAASEQVTLRAQLGYNIGEYDKFPGGPCWAGQTAAEGCVGGTQDLSGHRRSFAPEWNGSVGFSSNHPMPGMPWSLGVASDLIYYDEVATQTADNPFSRQDDYWRWNLRATLASDDGRWEFSVIGKNLTNERYTGGSADKPGGVRGDVQAQAIRPRQLLLQTTYRFAQ